MKNSLKINPNYLVATLSVVIWVCLFSSPALAQKQIEPAYLSVADGVASPTVNDVIQDQYGLIWIATGNGLQKYDGYRFETFKNDHRKSTSLQNNACWGLIEDADHNIWVGNDQGVSRFDRKKNEFINYDFTTTFKSITGSAGGRTYRLVIDHQGELWAGTELLSLIHYEKASDQWKSAKYHIDSIPQQSHPGAMLGLAKDSKGGFWAADQILGLLYRPLKGDTFKPVQPELFRKFANRENRISGLYSDVNNTLWITSKDGVYKYDPQTGLLKTIKTYTDELTDNWTNWNRILPDQAGNIWIANNFRGILKFEGTSDRFEELTIAGKTKIPGRGWNITLTNFIVDRSGIFWFGSREFGLLKYNPVSKPFTVFSHNDAKPSSLSNGAYGILASKVKPGIIYVGTKGSGFDIFNTKTKTAKQVTYKVVEDMYGGSVRSLGEDKDGTLWLGTWGDGLIKLDRNYREVKRYTYKSRTPGVISAGKVRVIKPDNKGKLWIGTAGGLDIFNPQTGYFQRIISKDTRTYPQNLITEIEKLAATDQKVGSIERVTENQNKTQRVEIKSAGTYAVMVVGEGDPIGRADFGWIENAANDTIWQMKSFDHSFYAGGSTKNRVDIQQIELKAGTYSLRYATDDSHSFGAWNEPEPDLTTLYGMVLIRLTDQNRAFIQDLLKPKKQELAISGSDIYDIEVGKKYVWVSALEKGLNRIDPATNTVREFRHDPANENTVASDMIVDIYEDERGMIWLTTMDGVNKFDPKTEKFTRYTEADGLPTNRTIAILPGNQGEMWIATENGLSQMVTNEALGKITFINYNSADGLGADSFVPLAATKGSDGQFYFGGDHGLTNFSSFKGNNTPPAVIISNLLISNKSVLDMKEDSPLAGSLLEAKTIVLSFDQNNLGFEFAALHYANPQKNQYAHRLKGYDKDWIYDNRNFAGYTNLDPGDYEFMVRASNAYGVWNEKGRTLKITILPPWWRTWWAYVAYICLLAFGLFTINRYLQSRIKLRERERSREKELQQAKEIEKAYTELKATQNQLIQSEKMASLGELTAGIAHEIQNPLNFITNFSETSTELLDEMKTELDNGNTAEARELATDVIRNLEKINHHGKRADAIVKGMLQHSRTGSGQKVLTDINALTEEYIRLGFYGVRAKDQHFNATIKTDFDQTLDKMEMIPQDIGRVVLNLLNNAFYAVQQKQAPESGYDPTITVSTKKTGDKVLLRVADNGNGIPQKVVDKIFQPFFTTKPTGQGTGLGLSLSYDIVTKGHGGALQVESREGEGSVFIIQLPLS